MVTYKPPDRRPLEKSIYLNVLKASLLDQVYFYTYNVPI